MNKKFIRVAAFSAAALSFIYILTLDSSRPLKEVDTTSVEGVKALKAFTESQKNKATPAAASETKNQASVKEEQESPSIEPGIQEIKQFRKKVFLTEKERAYKTEIIQNTKFLRTMARWLNNPNTDHDNISFAIDSLIEGLNGGSAVAREEIVKLIQDNRIEDPKLALTDREALAGIKAELLHLWSAQENIDSIIEPLLPGKVSKKLWANVKAHQENNYQESLQQLAHNKSASAAE